VYAQAAEAYGINAEDIEHPQQDFLEKGHEIVKSLFHLIGNNALLYLSIYPNEVESRWPLNAPEALIQKAESTKPKNRRAAYDELWVQGYAKIRYCKIEISEGKHSSTGQDTSEDKKLVRHWRRGHWRNQPHGAGLKDRKLIWIKPCLVGSVDKPKKVREYQVE